MCFVTKKDASQFSQWNVPIRTFLSYVQPSGYTNLKILTSSLNKYKLTTFSKLTPAESPHQARFPLIGDDVLCKCSDTLVHTKWPPFIKRLVATTKAKKIVMDVVLDPVLAGLYCGSPLIVVAIPPLAVLSTLLLLGAGYCTMGQKEIFCLWHMLGNLNHHHYQSRQDSCLKNKQSIGNKYVMFFWP